jgi:hypothetical protein
MHIVRGFVVAAWAKRTVVLVALMAMVAGLVPPASAQPAPAGGKGPTIGLVPEVFQPSKPNAAPKGSTVPTEMGDGFLGVDSRAGVGEPGEVVERRTEDSTTVVTDDGTFETTFYDSPVNYRDAKGDLQPIDNTLVPAAKPGALRNKAGAVQVSLPAVIGAEPVRATKGNTSVAFTLRGGAKGAPSIGVPEALATEAGDPAATDKQAKLRPSPPTMTPCPASTWPTPPRPKGSRRTWCCPGPPRPPASTSPWSPAPA